MGWLTDLLKELFPHLADSVKGGIRATLTSKRKKRNIYILKAMATDPYRISQDIRGRPFDLNTIDFRLYRYQIEQATEERFAMFPIMLRKPTPEEAEKHERAVKHQRKWGLPPLSKLGDPERLRQLEDILHEMVDDGRLQFHPPNMWSLKP